MFSGCDSLTSIDLSNFNTQNLTNMSYMFSECNSLTDINLSNFNTEIVTNMSYMFSECNSKTDIDLSNFNTQNVIDENNLNTESQKNPVNNQLIPNLDQRAKKRKYDCESLENGEICIHVKKDEFKKLIKKVKISQIINFI